MAGERTEAATPKRRQEARREGQVGKSIDVTVATALLGGLVILQAVGGSFLPSLSGIFRESLAAATTRELTTAHLQPFGWSVGMQAFTLVAPVMLGVVAITLIAGVGQVGLLFSTKAVTPQLSRLNPLTGLQRLVSPRGLVELVKSVAKIVLIGAVAYSVLAANQLQIVALIAVPPAAAAAAIAAIGAEIAFKCGLAYLALSALDYFYQRFEFEKSIRMSKDEIKQELKQQEGNPEIKARVKRIQRQMATSRMMAKVPKAAVVVTNPTHYAVALAYDSIADPAPRVVAKGVDLIALQIKRIAAEHDVPCVENVSLARTLYATVELDEAIPSELYQAVAEVLAYIYRLRGKR
ncbi:MAG: flagellar biosynthetic protein FlhB [Dehalococcoidia bacterium]|nr:MAG: flagellar biosynthetic protein FlhB [Dehalococcoidia bacterium]